MKYTEDRIGYVEKSMESTKILVFVYNFNKARN